MTGALSGSHHFSSSLTTAHWLAKETESLVDQTTLTSLLYEECCVPSPSLSSDQEQLLLALVHLPDHLANQLGRSLPSFLLPPSLFSRLGGALLGCLHTIHADLKGVLLYGYVPSLYGQRVGLQEVRTVPWPSLKLC